MDLMLQIIKDLAPLRRVLCSEDYDKSVEYLCDLLPFDVITFESKDEHNGWLIPPKWDVIEAKIIKDGRVIYDGLNNVLSVISYSKSFCGELSLEQLKKHLFYDHRFDDAIPYHFRQSYRIWDRDWGFCVPKILYDRLEEGIYSVIVKTKEAEGALKILDYTKEGETKETFAFVAHLDHPGMANDDLSGCAVGIQLFKKLLGMKTKYTYKLLLVQEIIGSQFYLEKQKKENKNHIIESLFLEMLGTNTQLAVQKSLGDTSLIENSLLSAAKEMNLNYRVGPFRSIIRNDEIIFEAFDIPMASVSRYPYPEYHSDRDNFLIISKEKLEESLSLLVKLVNILENTSYVNKLFSGCVCLSNPKYNLYIDPGQIAFGNAALSGTDMGKLTLLMDLIQVTNKPKAIRQLSADVGFPETIVVDYLKKWEEKKLVKIV